MGYYCYIRGNIIIKPEFIEKLKPRFTYDRIDSEEPIETWGEIDLPNEIKDLPIFEELVEVDSSKYSPFVPGSNRCGSWGFEKCVSRNNDDYEQPDESPPNVMDFNINTGELILYTSVRNTYEDSIFAFMLMMPYIAIKWNIEYDSQRGVEDYPDKPWFVTTDQNPCTEKLQRFFEGSGDDKHLLRD